MRRIYIFLLSTFLINVLILFFLLTPCDTLRPPFHSDSVTHESKLAKYKGSRNHMQIKGKKLGMELYPTGSSLPDCSYACGPCVPCRRVMVSFTTCSVESCPVVYRCVCKGRYFHVPSN